MEKLKCPECGREVAPDTASCPDCGYKFKRADGGKLNETTFKQYAAELEKQIDGDNKTLKTVGWVQKIIELIGGAMVVIGIILVIAWVNKSELEKLDDLKSMTESLKALAFIMCISAAIAIPMEEAVECFLNIRRSKWISEKKADYTAYIKNNAAFGFEGGDKNLYIHNLKTAAFIAENPNEKLIAVVTAIAYTAACLAAGICLSVWVSDNFTNEFTAQTFELDYNWQFGALFITSLVFVAASLLIMFGLTTFQENRCKKWCRERGL